VSAGSDAPDELADERLAAAEEVPPDFADDRPDAPPPSLGRRMFSWRALASLVLTLALLYWFARQLGYEGLVQSWQLIRQANPALYLAAFVVYYLSFPIRAVRWRLLLENSGEPPERLPRTRDLAEIIYLSWFVNSVVPAKLGDVYRGYLLRRESGVSWSHGMGTIVAERVLDLILLVTLMVGAGVLTYGDVLGDALRRNPVACIESGIHPEALSCTLLQLFTIGIFVAFGLLVGLAVFARFGVHLERWLPGRLGHVYQRFSAALVLSFGRFPRLISISALAWLCEGMAFWLVSRSLGLALPVPMVIFLSLLQAFATAIPLTAGGVGVVEIVLTGALKLRGYPASQAAAMVLLYRTISFLSLVVGGAIVYFRSEKTK
jgi:glycosyltransferase 2 family protein